jgi:hypothetical protein
MVAYEIALENVCQRRQNILFRIIFALSSASDNEHRIYSKSAKLINSACRVCLFDIFKMIGPSAFDHFEQIARAIG